MEIFINENEKVKVMVTWKLEERKKYWEMVAIDRMRFKYKIEKLDIEHDFKIFRNI